MMTEKIATNKANTCLVYDTIIEAPYCALQKLLRFEEPIAYTAGQLGWNADVYDFADDFRDSKYGDVCVCTGYRPFGNVKSCKELNALYEKMAQYFYDHTEPEKREGVLHALAVAWITVTLLHAEAMAEKETETEV